VVKPAQGAGVPWIVERVAGQLKITKSVKGGFKSETSLHTFGDLGSPEVRHATTHDGYHPGEVNN
jgi:hypothetical protein